MIAIIFTLFALAMVWMVYKSARPPLRVHKFSKDEGGLRCVCMACGDEHELKSLL